MDGKDIVDGSRTHSIFTWSAGRDVHPLALASAEGSWLTLANGHRLLDFNSQSMNANLGHKHPYMVDKLKRQLDALPHAAPAFATALRADVSQALSATLPKALNKILYCLGGAEANENAFRAARMYTGKQKIISNFRSYHGATAGAIAATGDPRRWANEPSPPGFIHVLGLQPYHYTFGAGEKRVDAHLQYLEEVIRGEGAQTIAAMIIEPVVGTNGVLFPPKGYLKRLKNLLERYEILMICDEVMSGFGRCGTFWGVDRDGITPDLITMAKGMTCGYVPGGAVAFHERISNYFEEHNFVGGLTCNSHPLVLAAVAGVLEIFEREQIMTNVTERAEELAEGFAQLKSRHPSVQATRSIGLMGMIDLQDSDGRLLANLGGHPSALKYLKADLLEAGVYAFMRWSHLCAFPPLNISQDELQFGLAAFDSALTQLDQRLGF